MVDVDNCPVLCASFSSPLPSSPRSREGRTMFFFLLLLLFVRPVQMQLVHDFLVRKEIHNNDGIEIATNGDSFQVAFHTVDDAINFCLAVQVSLLKAPWRKEIENSPTCKYVKSSISGEDIFRGPRGAQLFTARNAGIRPNRLLISPFKQYGWGSTVEKDTSRVRVYNPSILAMFQR